MNEDLVNKSEFLHFGILPQVCIHSPIEDEYSKMYIAQETCECGSSTWIESTMILGHFPDGEAVEKDVHRCDSCNEVRMAKHIGIDQAKE